jgi:hypothetical protein
MAVATKEGISSVQTATTTIPRASRLVREPFGCPNPLRLYRHAFRTHTWRNHCCS